MLEKAHTNVEPSAQNHLTPLLSLLLLGGLSTSLLLALKGSMILPLLGLAATGVAALAIRFPLIGLGTLIFVIIANVSDNLIVFFGLPSIAKLVAPGLLSLLLVRWIVFGEKPYANLTVLGLIGGFWLLTALSIPIAADPEIAIEALADLAKNLVVALLALAFFNRAGSWHVAVVTAVLVATAICALGSASYLLGTQYNPYLGFVYFAFDYSRFAGPIRDPNFWAALLVFMIPFAVQHMLNATSILQKATGFVVALLLLAGILLSESRGALVSLATAMVFLLIFLPRRQTVTLILCGLAIVVIAGSVASDELLKRYRTIFELASPLAVPDISVEGRLASWTVAWDLFVSHPFFGVGAGNFNTYYQNTALDLGLIFRGEGRSAHSLYLEMLAEHGLVGLGYLLIIMAMALRGVIIAIDRARAVSQTRAAIKLAAWGAGLFGYLFSMIFLHDAYPRFLWILLCVSMALGEITRLRIEDEAARRKTGGLDL